MEGFSKRLFAIMILYVCTSFISASEHSVDLLNVIAETQHSYCYKSSPCDKENVSNEELGLTDSVDSVNTMYSEHTLNQPPESNLNYTNYFWKDQIKLRNSGCCRYCSCQLDICLQKGTCCPDVHQSYSSFLASTTKQTIHCMAMQMKPRTTNFDHKIYPNSVRSVNMVTKCPKDDNTLMSKRKRDVTKQNCESDTTQLDILGIIPVTNILTNQTYKNQYCAECHGISEDHVYFWDAEIACNGSTLIPTTIDNIVSNVQDRSDCNIIFSSEFLLPRVDECEIYISECNITGKWKKMDPVIDLACRTYTAVYLSEFRNVFCYLCNTADQLGRVACDFITISKTYKSFSLLFNYKNLKMKRDSTESGDYTMCPGFTVYDPHQEKCVQVTCMEPKLYRNGSCVNLGEKIGGVGHNVFLVFRPLSTGIDSVIEAIEQYVAKLLNDTGLDKFILTFSVHVKRNISDEDAIDYYVTFFQFYFSASYSQSISMVDSILDKHGTIIKVPSNQNNAMQSQFLLELELFDVHEEFKPGQYLTGWNLTDESVVRLLPFDSVLNKNLSRYDLWAIKDVSIVPLLPLNRCPLIHLNSTFYEIVHHPWGLSIGRYGVKLKKSEYVYTDAHDTGSVVQVCKQTLEKMSDVVETNVGVVFVLIVWKHCLVLHLIFTWF